METDSGTLSIIGTGLMGASIGLATRARGVATEVIGYDVDPSRCEVAKARGAITSCARSIAEAVERASIVVIATPVDDVAASFFSASDNLAQSAAVTDLGSVKANLVSEVMATPRGKIHFVGGHPMTGSERSGPEAAATDLYDRCNWILTPTEETNPESLHKISDFVSRVGGQVTTLDPAQHDEVMALTSHLPQILSSALMAFVAGEAAEGDRTLIAAGGLRDMTRVASSSPELWTAIVRENRDSILDAFRRFAGSLQGVEQLIEQEDWNGLRSFLASARDSRRKLPEKAGLERGNLVRVEIRVPDRPGVLAEITGIVADAGVNVENLEILHIPEKRGVIKLYIAGSDGARSAVTALESKGFTATAIED